jgi:hypothetical protein
MESSVHLVSLELLACNELQWTYRSGSPQTLTLETEKLNNCLAGKISRLRFGYVGHQYMQ